MFQLNAPVVVRAKVKKVVVLSRTLSYSWFCRHSLLAGVPVFFNFVSLRCRPGHGRDMIYHIDPKVMYVPLTLVNIERGVHSDLKATLMLNSLQTHLMSSLISGHIEYYHQRSLLLSLLLSAVSCVEHCDWSCQENWSVWEVNVVKFLLKVVLHADDAPGPVMDTSPHTPLQNRVGWWDSKWRYWSVRVGFLLTEMSSRPSIFKEGECPMFFLLHSELDDEGLQWCPSWGCEKWHQDYLTNRNIGEEGGGI